MAKRKSQNENPENALVVEEIPLDQITTDRFQPRYNFDRESLNELKNSIRKDGLLNPITVEMLSEGNYKIVLGERRFRAYRELKMNKIPAIIIRATDKKIKFAKQIAENIHRQDLSPVERGRALIKYKELLGDNTTWSKVEEQLSISETRRKQLIRLLDLPEEIQKSITNFSKTELKSKITEAHARALLKLREYPDKQKELFYKLTADDVNYTAAEAETEAYLLLANVNEERKYKYTLEYSNKEELKTLLRNAIDDIENGTRSKIKSSSDTLIDWTDKTWNPTTGCKQIAPGCTNCYAKEKALNYQKRGIKAFQEGFNFRLQKHHLHKPFQWRTPQMIFVNSMSDLFYEDLNFDYIDKVMDVIRNTPHHLYQILTKRPEQMFNYCKDRDIPENAWLGVTVENKEHGIKRMDILREISAKVKFISAEPLLEDLGQLDLENIDWVIVGGESGENAREIHEDWVINIKSQCEEWNIPFFFKQWGDSEEGVRIREEQGGDLVQGKIFHEYPDALKESLVV